jgi:dTMP kinase
MLIVLEGIDGTGKSTQASLLAEWLRNQGHRVLTSREPTDGPYGTKLRQSASTGRLSPEEELQLFLQDRTEHVETLITPALEAGEIVILDRYYFSSMAYQGVRGFDPAEIRRLNEEFAPKPDLLLLLELSVDEALDRIGVRDGEANAFEQRDSLQKCHDVFHTLIEEPFVQVIDTRASVEDVHEAIKAVVGKVIA